MCPLLTALVLYLFLWYSEVFTINFHILKPKADEPVWSQVDYIYDAILGVTTCKHPLHKLMYMNCLPADNIIRNTGGQDCYQMYIMFHSIAAIRTGNKLIILFIINDTILFL